MLCQPRASKKLDVLLVEHPQGRLQNKAELMNELEKSRSRHQEGRRVGAACGAAGA